MSDLDETNALLREIRDLIAAQEGRFDKNLAANKQLYEDVQRRMVRRQVIAGIVVAVGIAMLLLATR